MHIRSLVEQIPAAPSELALEHFESRLTFETDCWDVHQSLQEKPDFLLVDVRSLELFSRSHIPGAINIPHPQLTRARLAEYPQETLFVVYCAGPHCNGAGRAALRLAKMKRPVKEMIGGVEGWKDEGFALSHQVDK